MVADHRGLKMPSDYDTVNGKKVLRNREGPGPSMATPKEVTFEETVKALETCLKALCLGNRDLKCSVVLAALSYLVVDAQAQVMSDIDLRLKAEARERRKTKGATNENT